MPPIPPLTKNLMLACTAVFCLQVFLSLDRWLALWPLGSGLFMPWQIVSYAFLHGGMGHLFFNMLGLWMFGSELERLWGPKRYWQFLLAGVLAAAAAQLLVTWLTGSNTPTVGASGALFALLLAFGMLFPNRIKMCIRDRPGTAHARFQRRAADPRRDLQGVDVAQRAARVQRTGFQAVEPGRRQGSFGQRMGQRPLVEQAGVREVHQHLVGFGHRQHAVTEQADVALVEGQQHADRVAGLHQLAQGCLLYTSRCV